MNRTAGMLLVMAALGGCMSTGGNSGWGPTTPSVGGDRVVTPPLVPGVQGPWGQPVVMAAPYAASPPNELAARQMLAQSVPLDMVQMHSGMSSGVVQAGYLAGGNGASGLVPAGATACPGMPPGAAISPPGVPFAPSMPAMSVAGTGPPGAVAAAGALTGAVPNRFAAARTEVRFVSPPGMKIAWYTPGGDGKGGFGATQLEVPGRYNFVQAAIYRLKVSDIAGHGNLELYPTLEVVPSNLKTMAFLAHSSVPVAFTEEDIEQVIAGNYVVKVIYLPDPQFQDLAATGTEEVVSSRLEPGVDPIAEAYRRGSILLVIRIGNIDLEAPNTPAMDAPSPYAPRPAALPGPMPPGMVPGPGMPGMAGMPGMPGMPMPPGMGGMMQQGMMPPGMADMMQQGMMPPGMAGMMQQGMMPPGMMPSGMMPPGMTAQGMMQGTTGPGTLPESVLNGKPTVMMGPNGPVMVSPAGPVNTTPGGGAAQPSSAPAQPGSQDGSQSKAAEVPTTVQLANYPNAPGAFPTSQQAVSPPPRHSLWQKVFGKNDTSSSTTTTTPCEQGSSTTTTSTAPSTANSGSK